MSGCTPVPDGDGPATLPELVRAARLRAAPGVWDMVSGGAESETTLRRNREAMERYAFVPDALRGVESVDLTTTVLGRRVASPVQLAPVGTIAQYHGDGALVPARVAQERGILSVVGVLSTPPLEQVAAAVPDALLALQLYVRGNQDWLRRTVGAAEDAGYAAVVLSVDSTGAALRERERHNRYDRPYARTANIPGPGRGTEHQVRLTWEDVARLRSMTTLPLAVKGLTNPRDSARAVEHGVDAVYVSNHGGRELDHLPASIEVLAEHVDAVAGRAEVLVDSGFVRGSDVVKALALGARAVLVGKLQLWGLLAGGADGLTGALRLLDEEVAHVLQLLGVRSPGELNRGHLRPATPTRRTGPAVTTYEPLSIPDL